MSDPPISRYGGYVHSNPNYEDFEMWNSVCEDAEPDWEYRNAQREAREQRERAQRAAERMEQEQKEKRQREEQERKEWEARRALARKEAAKKEQEKKERETESYWRRSEAVHTGSQRHWTSQNEQASNDIEHLFVIHHNHNSNFEEEDVVLGAEDDRLQSEHEKPVDPNLVFELDHVEDILRTVAESLRTEQEESMRIDEAKSVDNEDTTHT